MENIEIGEYVRTDKGHIFKIDKENLQIAKFLDVEYGNIVKQSKQLIDLIEVGDYVNDHRVIMNLKESKKHYKSKDDFVTCRSYTFEENEIKTILTKEMYEANCYKVGGEDE